MRLLEQLMPLVDDELHRQGFADGMPQFWRGRNDYCYPWHTY
jgi:hypothetical protein